MGETATPTTLYTAQQVKAFKLGQLVDWWRGWDREVCQGDAALYATAAKRAIQLGEYLLGYDFSHSGLGFHKGDVTLRQMRGLALARSGAVESARAEVEALRDEGHDDEETLGLLGRIYKDLWEGGDQADDWLTMSRNQYAAAFELRGGYWTAINAATLSACAGDADAARTFGTAARDLAIEKEAGGTGDNWLLATLGEAALVLGDVVGAEAFYRAAAVGAAEALGDLASMRRNLRLLVRHTGRDEALVERWLPMPAVVVFAGHVIDAPGRRPPRFAPQREAEVAAAIGRALDRIGAGIGIASAASGADILFLEAMVARPGSDVTVAIPYDLESFIRDSVAAPVGGPGWVDRLRAILRHPHVRVLQASMSRMGEVGACNLYGNQVMAGLGAIKANHFGTRLAGLAVWDGQPGDGRGGTADSVALWSQLGWATHVIDPRDPAREVPVTPAGPPRAAASPAADVPPPDEICAKVMSLLFADAVGYSKLTDEDIPLFIEHVMRPVSKMLRESPRPPAAVNTWGDAFYFSFDSTADAGRFALRLADFINGLDWSKIGFSRSIQLRTALHSGPVYAFTDPITDKLSHTGNHVSRAARIEPVTPPGQVYVSELFAALAYVEGARDFRCEYVGNVGMAKGYGNFRTFVMRRRG